MPETTVNLGPTTTMVIKDECLSVNPCSHVVTIASPLDTQTHTMTAARIACMYASAGLKPPPHYINQVMKHLKKTNRMWAPKRIDWI